MLVDPIKADMGISDVQISLLQGFSFALLFAVLAIPIAWIADRGSRKWVIIIGLVCWTAATAGSGFATTFALLFVARMGVGIGEASLGPAGISLISDSVSPRRLPLAVAIMTSSGFVGTGLAVFVGGHLISWLDGFGPVATSMGIFQPWQMSFLLLSTLSIPVFFLLLAIKEPLRQPTSLRPEENVGAFELATFLSEHKRFFAAVMLGFSCFAAANFGLGAWVPTYLMRVRDWNPAEIGNSLGPILMIGGTAGVILGGVIAEWMMRRGVHDATIKLPIMAGLAAIPMTAGFIVVEDQSLSILCLGVAVFLISTPFGAGVSTLPLVTPSRLRSQVVATYILVANLIGYSGGPFLIALLSDHVFSSQTAIEPAILTAVPFLLLIGAALLMTSLRHYKIMIDKRRAPPKPAMASSWNE